MRRLLFVVIVILCALTEVHAQYNIYVKNANGDPLKGVVVYTFPTRSMGENAIKKFDNGAFPEELKHTQCDEPAETNEDGLCIMKCMPAGSIILEGGGVVSGAYDTKLFYVEDYLKDELDLNLNLVLSGTEFRTTKDKPKGKTDFERTVFRMDEVDIGGSSTMPDILPPDTERFGDKIKITKELEIRPEYARDDARFAASPIIVFDSVRDSVVYMPPVAVDGKDYSKSMERRMSFRPCRDQLDEFRHDRSVRMQSHNGERFIYSQWARIEKGTKYHIPGVAWFEDYNGVYHTDSVLFSDGKEKEPMRFLNWSDARRLIELDGTDFAKQGTYVAVPQEQSFLLKFEQGRSELNLKDSLTIAQRDSMLHWLAGKKDNLSKIEVRGYSSPEGTEKRNRELSHSRAKTISDLLKAHFPSVGKINAQFDENDNIVTWQEIANLILLENTDSANRRYADKILELIADKNGFDAQYRAIRADKELYDYLDKYVLERVRRVNIQAHVVVRKILSRDEIVERYEADTDFRGDMELYQYYEMLCYLYDNERWDELYEVSKRAYELYPRERQVTKMILAPTSEEPFHLSPVPTWIPYPLAGYYYAVSSLKKGVVDVNILKPYLDDGNVGLRKRDVQNLLPFVVVQVLMYCQGEKYDDADYLLRKYHLKDRKKYPELYGLAMFVRCLGGHYKGKENEEVRRYVMSTSDMNKAVMHVALAEYEEALKTLYDGDVPENDAKVEYLKAISLFNLQETIHTKLDCESLPTTTLYDASLDTTQLESKEYIRHTTWAAPMLEALRLDTTNVAHLENDGYFNNAYRQMLLYFWKRLQAGVPIAKVVMEYNALVAQMRKQKTQNK